MSLYEKIGRGFNAQDTTLNIPLAIPLTHYVLRFVFIYVL